MRNDRPSAFVKYLSDRKSVPHSVHLSKLTDTQLSRLHDSLIYTHDAHATHRWRNGVRQKSKPVAQQLRDYFQAVKLEMLTRKPVHSRLDTPARYETRRPVNVLKRVVENLPAASQGSVSLADMQAGYARLKHHAE